MYASFISLKNDALLRVELRISYLTLKSFSKYSLQMYISENDQINGENNIKEYVKAARKCFDFRMSFLVVEHISDGEKIGCLTWKDKNEDEKLRVDELHCVMEMSRHVIGLGNKNRILRLIEMLKKILTDLLPVTQLEIVRTGKNILFDKLEEYQKML